jgi:hypothetical protein
MTSGAVVDDIDGRRRPQFRTKPAYEEFYVVLVDAKAFEAVPIGSRQTTEDEVVEGCVGTSRVFGPAAVCSNKASQQKEPVHVTCMRQHVIECREHTASQRSRGWQVIFRHHLDLVRINSRPSSANAPRFQF